MNQRRVLRYDLRHHALCGELPCVHHLCRMAAPHKRSSTATATQVRISISSATLLALTERASPDVVKNGPQYAAIQRQRVRRASTSKLHALHSP